jgi:hypothetical protein
MKHAARGLLAHKHFPDPFLEGSDLSHPAVDIERGFAVWCHGGDGFVVRAIVLVLVLVLVVVVVVVVLEGWRSVRSTVWRDVGLSSCGLFIALGRTQFRGRGRGRGRWSAALLILEFRVTNSAVIIFGGRHEQKRLRRKVSRNPQRARYRPHDS